MTPTPWHVGKKYQTDVYSKSKTVLGGTLVARSTIDDAAHIVKCVNCHDDLLAALRELLPNIGDNANLPDNAYVPVDMTMGEIRRARAAIAKATA